MPISKIHTKSLDQSDVDLGLIGNVGIGTETPTAKLHVLSSAAAATGYYRNTNASYASDLINEYAPGGTTASRSYFSARSDGTTWVTSDYGAMLFLTGTGGSTAERMRLSTTGGLSLGTTANPGAGAIFATGNITAYYSSDVRLKENIKDIDNALDIVCAIGSKTFDWTDDVIQAAGGEDGYFVQKSDFGVIAQDVQAVFPQAVRTRKDGTLAVDYEKLAVLSFGAIKELVKRVEALEAR